MVESTFLGIGTLRKSTGIVGVVSAGFAQRLFSQGSVQGNTRMTIGFENSSAMGTSNSFASDGLMATGTILHRY